MTIATLLTHRATVERSTQTMLDGVPVLAWSVVSVRCPVRYSRDEVDFDPSWSATERREADQRGTLFTLPTADLRPGDRVHITRPPMSGSFEILPDPSDVLSLAEVHHREYKIRSVG